VASSPFIAVRQSPLTIVQILKHNQWYGLAKELVNSLKIGLHDSAGEIRRLGGGPYSDALFSATLLISCRLGTYLAVTYLYLPVFNSI